MRPLFVGLSLLLGSIAACTTADITPADLVLRNGKIVTVDSAKPEAQALAVRGDTIVAVGTEDEIAPYIGGKTQLIDLEGMLAVPGFIEGHGHFMSLGEAKMQLDLTKAASWDEIVKMVGDAAVRADSGAWIQGWGWHQEKWNPRSAVTVEGLPTHEALSRASPRNPVLLSHASGHASFANARALELAGIARGTKNPPGGEIVHDARGNPTGVLRETAQRLADSALARSLASRSAAQVDAERRRAVELASQEALSKGVTSFQDAGSSFETIDFLKALADSGKLPLRLYVMVRHETNDEMEKKLPSYRMIDAGNGHLTVRAIKRQIDGALGSHGAWLLEPYIDLPSSTGLVLEPVAEIERTAELAMRYGYQVNTHAIGDRANREVLDLYERVFAKHTDKRDVRWRIEHAQHVNPSDVPRFAKLGVIASMQGVHATSDGPWIPKRLGEERTRTGAYVWRDLLSAGTVITNGTDVPVEDVDPLASFTSSVTRRMKDGKPFYPTQRMTREEALRSYTLNGAYAAFEERRKGSLTPGKLADITVISKDIVTIPDDQLPSAKVVYTIVGGEVLYRANGGARP